MMREVGIDPPVKGRRFSYTNEPQEGINFERFCAIMGVDVQVQQSLMDS